MQSYLYHDLNKKNDIYSALVNRVEEFAQQKEADIFMIRIPKNDLDETLRPLNGCFMFLSARHKIALVNAFATKEAFANYVEDVKDVLSYLFMKYEYRSKLGRFNSLADTLIIESSLADMEDLDVFWQTLDLPNNQQRKYADLMVALCTGSINDINRVGDNVPTNLLDQVKQKIQLFDADQTRFIYQESPSNSSKKTIKIQGLSGTGKTELLLHKLKQLYTADDNTRIFVTCHNKILAASLHDRIPDFFNFMKVDKQILWEKRLWCTNAWGSLSDKDSGLYRYLCNYYEIPYASYTRNTSFDAVCKKAVEDIKAKKKGGDFKYAFDYILVDECQDFMPSFVELCKLITAKRVYLAGDLFQSIFAEYSKSDYEADFFLSKCYRTDPRTLMFAHALGLGLFEDVRYRWLYKEDWRACGYTYLEQGNSIILGREPVKRFLDVKDDYDSIELFGCQADKMADGVIRVITKIKEEFPTITPDDVCVIMLDDENYIYTLANVLEAKCQNSLDWPVNKAYESKNKISGQLLVSNRNNVKGLEYPFVICLTMKLASDYPYRNAIYTMLSRSFIKSYLLVPTVDNGITESIKKGLKEIKNNHQMTIRIPSEQEIQSIQTRFTRAKERKPLAEIVDGLLIEMKVGKEKRNRIIDFTTNLGWEGYGEEEIKTRLVKIVEIL